MSVYFHYCPCSVFILLSSPGSHAAAWWLVFITRRVSPPLCSVLVQKTFHLDLNGLQSYTNDSRNQWVGPQSRTGYICNQSLYKTCTCTCMYMCEEYMYQCPAHDVHTFAMFSNSNDMFCYWARLLAESDSTAIAYLHITCGKNPWK